jgi:hypothetical protein
MHAAKGQRKSSGHRAHRRVYHMFNQENMEHHKSWDKTYEIINMLL